MQPNFDVHNGDRFIPDFYVVGGHGCGRLSLTYYLSWLGLPVSPEDNMKPTKDTICLPVQKNEKTYGYGLTVDRLPQDLQPLAHENENPVIWMVRDPIKIMVSLYNYCLGDVVFCKGNPEVFIDNPLIPFFTSHISLCALYSSLKKITASTANPFIVQTEDLFADKCVNTLENIARYLNVPFSNTVCDIATINYNSFLNRLWSRQPAKFFPINIFLYPRPYYYLAPDKLFDFWFNQWKAAKILANFEYKSQVFTLGMPFDQYKFFEKDISQNYFTPEKICALKKYIEIWEIHCDLTRKLYDKYSVTAEKALDVICANHKFKSRFLRFMDNELKDFAAEYPDIVKNWKYFNCLL